MNQEVFDSALRRVRELTTRCDYKKAEEMLDKLALRDAYAINNQRARYYLNLEYFYLYYSQRDLESCEIYLNQASDLMIDDCTRAWTKLIAGYLNVAKQDHKKAMSSAEESFTIFKKLNYVEGILESIDVLANAASGSGDYNRALALLDEGLSIAVGHDIPYSRTSLLLTLAKVKISQGNYDEGLDVLSEAKKVSKQEDFKERLSLAHSLLSHIHYNQGNYGAALEGYQQSLDLYQEIGNLRGTAASVHNLALVLRQQGKLNKSIDYFRRALDFFRGFNDQFQVAHTLFNIGLLHGEQGDYPRAEEFFTEALTLAEKSAYEELRIMLVSALGELSLARNDLVKAKEYLYEAESGYRDLSIKDRRYADTLQLLVRVQIQESDPAAQVNLNKIQNLANELKSSYLEVCYLYFQALYFHVKNLLEKAEEYYLKALSLAREIELYIYQLGPLIQLAQIEFLKYQKNGDISHRDELQAYIEQALTLSERQEILPLQAKIRILRGLLHSIDLDYDNAVKELQGVISFTQNNDLGQEREEAGKFYRDMQEISKEYRQLLESATKEIKTDIEIDKARKIFEKDIDDYLNSLTSTILNEL